jgi:hypothetical protein
MAIFPKVPRLDTRRVSAIPGRVAPRSLKLIPKLAKLDFAANPNHYGVNARAKVKKKVKKSLSKRIDLSPRLVLGLSLECETPPPPLWKI